MPFVDSSSKDHCLAAVRRPDPTFGVHEEVPLQPACASLPLNAIVQMPSETCCDSRLSNARASATASTDGHTAFASEALRRL